MKSQLRLRLGVGVYLAAGDKRVACKAMAERHGQHQKRLLFSLHGIYTDGPWQEGTAAVLSPFYRYTPIKYREFRHWAITKLALDLLICVALMVIAIILWHFRLIPPTLPWWLSYILLSLSLIHI